MDEAEVGWMNELLLAVQPPLDYEVVARILRRVKNLWTDTYVIQFPDLEYPQGDSVLEQLDRAIAETREDLNSLYAKRLAEHQWIEEEERDWNEYYTENPGEAEWHEEEQDGFAPTGTLSVSEMQKGAVDQFFVPERGALLQKQNRLLLLRHLIFTRGRR